MLEKHIFKNLEGTLLKERQAKLERLGRNKGDE